MKLLVCIAGLPGQVAELVHARPSAVFTEERNNTPIVRPIKEPYGYREGMADAYLHELAERLSHLNLTDEAAVLLAYVKYNDNGTHQFVRKFFPFALTTPLAPFFPDHRPKHERRAALQAYVKEIEDTVGSLRTRARVVRDVLSGQNFSPLLLPLRNFESDILVPQIETLYECLGSVDDTRVRLQGAAQTLLRRHPMNRNRDRWGNTPYFKDDRELCFKSPGRNRHAMARVLAEGHRPTCLISARVRLGGPYDPLFHYDCENMRGGIDHSYPNCHGFETEPAQNTHVNIAPNDAVR